MNELTKGEYDELTQYLALLETKVQNEMLDINGMENYQNLSLYKLTKILMKKFANGEITSNVLVNLRASTLATQQAYARHIIQIFKLKPEDLDTTSVYFCKVFGICELPTTTITTSTTITSTSTIITTTSTTSTTTTTTDTTTTTTTNPTTNTNTNTNPNKTTTTTKAINMDDDKSKFNFLDNGLA